MKRTWKGLICAVILAGLMLAPTACNRGGQDGEGNKDGKAKYVVGISLLTRGHEFFRDMEAQFNETAKELNMELLINAADMDVSRQISQVEDFITKGVDAIILVPADSRGIAPAIKAANKANIPVFTADIKAEGTDIKVVSFIASDNLEGGQLAAKFLADQLGGQGEVAIIEHPGVSSSMLRVQGFEETMAKEFPNITIVAKQSSEGMMDKAVTVMENILQSHPEIDGVFGINDDSALGALRAAELAGRMDLIIVGYDATKPAQAAILKGGPLKADVVQHPKEIGRKALQAVADHLAGKQVESWIPVEVGVVTKEDLEKQQ